VAAVLLAAGCRDGATGREGPVVPPPDVARRALDRALDAWKAGLPAAVGPEGKTPEVGLVDGDRIEERRLLGYEVLGPIDLGVGRGFTVRLKLDAPEPDEPVVRYVVFGQEPVWVFRLEDYERISHWEHKMDPDEDDEPVPPGG
jgi:hypothetical protein